MSHASVGKRLNPSEFLDRVNNLNTGGFADFNLFHIITHFLLFYTLVEIKILDHETALGPTLKLRRCFRLLLRDRERKMFVLLVSKLDE